MSWVADDRHVPPIQAARQRKAVTQQPVQNIVNTSITHKNCLKTLPLVSVDTNADVTNLPPEHVASA